MEITKKIENDLKQAMLTKNSELTLTLRNIKSKFLEAIKANSNKELDVTGETKVLEKMIRDRQKSIDAYKTGNRQDLADKEQKEIDIIQTYIPEKPEQMSSADIETAISTIITDGNYSTMKDMGKVMSDFNQKYPDKADKKILSEIVKNLLK